MISRRHMAIAASVLLASFGTFAQNNTVRLVVPFSTGGPTDIAARVIAPLLSEAMGKTVIVDNRVGATGAIGAEFVHVHRLTATQFCLAPAASWQRTPHSCKSSHTTLCETLQP